MLSSLTNLFGINPRKMVNTFRGMPFYTRDYLTIMSQRNRSQESFALGKPYPALHDRFEDGGTAKGHYFHQDLYVAQRIFKNKPELHTDLGSRIDGFVAHVASFRSIRVLDIREIPSFSSNVKFVQCDIMAPLASSLVESCDSISCLHALEHFGLGRYGESLNYDGHIMGFGNISQILQSGGKFYFSTPIGRQRIEFNSHRVFSIDYLLKMFESDFTVDSFSYVDDNGDLHKEIELSSAQIRSNLGCTFGCGIFELTKN